MQWLESKFDQLEKYCFRLQTLYYLQKVLNQVRRGSGVNIQIKQIVLDPDRSYYDCRLTLMVPSPYSFTVWNCITRRSSIIPPYHPSQADKRPYHHPNNTHLYCPPAAKRQCESEKDELDCLSDFYHSRHPYHARGRQIDLVVGTKDLLTPWEREQLQEFLLVLLGQHPNFYVEITETFSFYPPLKYQIRPAIIGDSSRCDWQWDQLAREEVVPLSVPEWYIPKEKRPS